MCIFKYNQAKIGLAWTRIWVFPGITFWSSKMCKLTTAKATSNNSHWKASSNAYSKFHRAADNLYMCLTDDWQRGNFYLQWKGSDLQIQGRSKLKNRQLNSFHSQ